jgi:hypothetical protein
VFLRDLYHTDLAALKKAVADLTKAIAAATEDGEDVDGHMDAALTYIQQANVKLNKYVIQSS